MWTLIGILVQCAVNTKYPIERQTLHGVSIYTSYLQVWQCITLVAIRFSLDSNIEF